MEKCFDCGGKMRLRSKNWKTKRNVFKCEGCGSMYTEEEK